MALGYQTSFLIHPVMVIVTCKSQETDSWKVSENKILKFSYLEMAKSQKFAHRAAKAFF